MDTLFFAANSILPIIIIIILGYFLRQVNFFDGNFLKVANKLVFKVFLPLYLFYNIYEIDNINDMNLSIVIACFGATLTIYLLANIFICLYTKDSGKRGALIQCAFRSNFAIIGVTLAESMGGTKAVASAAVISAVSIPLFNILAVITLSVFSEEKRTVNIKTILKSILTNPLIIGVCSGIIVLILRQKLFNGSFVIKENIPFLYKALKNVSSIASPLALIVLGGQFSFSAVKSLAKDILMGIFWRLILTPVLSLIAIILLSKYTDLIYINSWDFPALLALFGSPVAVSSAIMAEEMKSNGELARQLVVWTSIGSIITIFIFVVILRSMGLV